MTPSSNVKARFAPRGSRDSFTSSQFRVLGLRVEAGGKCRTANREPRTVNLAITPNREPGTSPSRLLHVANGTCTTGVIEAAGIPGPLSIWADPLYEGPVPGGVSDGELLEVRARYLAGPEETAEVEPVNDLRLWRDVIERHEAYDELILWFEHDLFDQLNLIQLLTWIRERLPAAKPVSLVCIGSFPGRPAFKGLGELTPGELAPLLDSRQRVSDAQYGLAARAWQAFREPGPEALDDFRRSGTAALPFLAAALVRFLQEYPWTADGLSRTERRLLTLADAGTDLSKAFPRMHEGEDAYYVTDLSLASMAESLARTSPPLLTLTSGRNGTHHALRGSISITDAGREVLAGRRDRIALCGIDRWLGGVHLVGNSNVWRWDDAGQKIVRGSGSIPTPPQVSARYS
jgi:hypothetical protein